VASSSDDVLEARMKMLVLFKSGIFSVDYAWTLALHEGEYLIARQHITPIGQVRIPPAA
jgi:hypothetical protein